MCASSLARTGSCSSRTSSSEPRAADDLAGASVLSLSFSLSLFLLLSFSLCLPHSIARTHSLVLVFSLLLSLSLSLFLPLFPALSLHSQTYRQSAFCAFYRRVPSRRSVLRTFPFIEETRLPHLPGVLTPPRCLYLFRLSLILAFSHSLSLTLSLSLTRSLAISLPFLGILIWSATHFETFGLRPHVAIVSGDRRFGNTPRCKQLLINVILPAHF